MLLIYALLPAWCCGTTSCMLVDGSSTGQVARAAGHQPACSAQRGHAAVSLAAALLDWWHHPSAQQAQQLEAAQAAAARSCAYLGCANLGGGGGPAAGQGETRKQCG